MSTFDHDKIFKKFYLVSNKLKHFKKSKKTFFGKNIGQMLNNFDKIPWQHSFKWFY